jgi:hypothetical protein
MSARFTKLIDALDRESWQILHHPPLELSCSPERACSSMKENLFARILLREHLCCQAKTLLDIVVYFRMWRIQFQGRSKLLILRVALTVAKEGQALEADSLADSPVLPEALSREWPVLQEEPPVFCATLAPRPGVFSVDQFPAAYRQSVAAAHQP